MPVLLRRHWYHWDFHWNINDPVLGEDQYFAITGAASTARMVVERTRLAVQACGISDVGYPYPSPVSPSAPMRAMFSYAPQITSPPVPPIDWPDPPNPTDPDNVQPVIWSMFTPRVVSPIPSTPPLTGFSGVYWAASIDGQEGDSAARRSFHDERLIAGWLWVSTVGFADGGGSGYTYSPVNVSGTVSSLVAEYYD